MSNHLIPVSKAGEYIEVHPSALAAHRALGWERTERRAPPDDGKQAAADAREALKVAGVDFDARTGKEKLLALKAAFDASGLTGEAWNALSDEARAAHFTR